MYFIIHYLILLWRPFSKEFTVITQGQIQTKLQTKRQISLTIHGFWTVTVFSSTRNKNCTVLVDYPRNGGQVMKKLLKIIAVDLPNTITKSNHTQIRRRKLKLVLTKFCLLFIFWYFYILDQVFWSTHGKYPEKHKPL